MVVCRKLGITYADEIVMVWGNPLQSDQEDGKDGGEDDIEKRSPSPDKDTANVYMRKRTGEQANGGIWWVKPRIVRPRPLRAMEGA